MIGHLEQRGVRHVDLALSGRSHFVVVRLDADADPAERIGHLAAKVVVRVGGTHREVAALEARLVSQVRFFEPGRVPSAFDGVHLIESAVLVLLVTHLVEDEELRLGTDVAGIGYARG